MIVNKSIWGALQDQANNSVFDCVGSIAPTSGLGGTGTNITGPGSTYTDVVAKIRYIQNGTIASPLWIQVWPSTGIVITNPIIKFLTEFPIPAGSVQGDATLVTIGAPGLLWVVGADGTKGVRLPTALAGMVYFMNNDETSNAVLKVWPTVGDQINAGAVNAVFNMPAKSACIYTCMVNTIWITIPHVPS